MIITMERPVGAPFNVYASEGKSELITQTTIENLETLTWESMVVKNYCLAVNQQNNLSLATIPELPDVQRKSRVTASLWLNKITYAINNVYSEVDYFCSTYNASYDKLKETAEDLENKTNKEVFIDLIDELQKNVKKINTKIQSLTRSLTDIRPRLEEDSRNFASLVTKAKKIQSGNVFKIETLNERIDALNEEIKSLNKKIAAAASIGTIGILAFIISAVVAVATGGTGIPLIVGGTIGLIAGVAGYTKLEQFNQAIKEKKAEYANKNQELQDIQAETATAIAVEKQYTSLGKSGKDAIEVVQNLFEGWQGIFTNFDRFLQQVKNAKNADDSGKIQKLLDQTNETIKKISDTIMLHQKSGLIKTLVEEPVTTLLASSHPKNRSLILPTGLYASYVNRMQEKFSMNLTH